MDTYAILGLTMIVVAVPGLLLGLVLLLGKWAPPIRAPDPDRVRKVMGLALVGGDAMLLLAGVLFFVLGS